MTDLECTNCGHPIEEPERTHTMDCPKCRAYLFVPSRKDWQALIDDIESDFLKEESKKHG